MDVSRRDFLRFSVAAGGEGKRRARHEADPGRSHASRAWIDGIKAACRNGRSAPGILRRSAGDPD